MVPSPPVPWSSPSLGTDPTAYHRQPLTADGLQQNLGVLPHGVDHVGRLRLGFQQEEAEAGGRRSGQGQQEEVDATTFCFVWPGSVLSFGVDRRTVWKNYKKETLRRSLKLFSLVFWLDLFCSKALLVSKFCFEDESARVLNFGVTCGCDTKVSTDWGWRLGLASEIRAGHQSLLAFSHFCPFEVATGRTAVFGTKMCIYEAQSSQVSTRSVCCSFQPR